MTTKKTDIDRNAAILLAILSRMPHRNALRTTLVKLAYLTDLISSEWNGTQLSTFRYRFDNHGPYDADIVRTAEELKRSGVVQRSVREAYLGSSEYRYSTEVSPSELPLGATDWAVIDAVASRWGHLSLTEIKEVVYMTPPMRAALRGQFLDLGSGSTGHKREIFISEYGRAVDAAWEQAKSDTRPLILEPLSPED